MFLACFLLSTVQAQYGPFGIGNADGIDNQPRLLLWLDGSTPTVAPESNVLVWPDKSGNDNHFTATAARSPVLKASGPNSRPYLLFNKENNRMTLANLTFENQGVSIFYVFKTADGNYGMFSFAESDANPSQILAKQSGGQNRFTIDGQEHTTNLGNLSNNVWRYAGFIWDGVNNPTYWHRSNGTGAPEFTESNVLNGLSTAANGTAVIGHIQNLLNDGYVTDESFQGELAEIFVYDGTVNKAHLRQINTYFRNKYNVGGTGGWDKLGAPAAYREGLIGIARDNGSNSEHRHSRADGLVLRANPGGLQGNFGYLSGSHDNTTNSIETTNLPAGVDARWNRDWFLRKDGLGNGSDIQIAFDFGEGIGGEFPFNAENYVLLYRTGTTGNYAIRTVNEVYIQDKEVVFRLAGSQIPNTGYYTLGTKDNILSSLNGQVSRTWHAYQSGNWSEPLTWTLDGSAAPSYVNPGGDIPALGDAIVVGSGRTVTANLTNRVQSSLRVFGTVDFAATSGHNMGAISGNGTIRCAGSSGIGNFPAGNTADFANPSTGGITEFYGSGFTQTMNLLLNRVRINLTNSSATLILAANFTHNGFFEINTGTFQINNNAAATRTLESFDNVLVESNGRITVSAANRQHAWTFHKDFTNEGGDVRFTNRTSPNYTSNETQGHVFARFVSATENQSLIANGISYFTRIIVNKGSNATYVLTISADGPNKFALFGNCNSNMGDSPYYAEGTGAQATSVSLINGTLEIREHIFLPLQTGANNFNINETAALWINGGFAAKGAPDVGPGNATAIVPYGLIRVSAGRLNANCNSGVTTRANGVLQVDGGEVYANQIRTSVFGPTNVGGIIITGGLVDVDGTRPGGTAGTYYTFSLTYPGNLFRMTGGELHVAGPTGNGLIFINSNPEQTSVSGGTVIADVKNTTDRYRITSRAPFWNLEVRRSDASGTNRPVVITGGTSFGEAIEDQPLLIRNSLRITGTNSPTLRMRSVGNNNIDAFIRGNFIVENGGVYDHFTNTTHFEGGNNSILSLPTGSTQTFHNVVVNKNDETRFAEIQGGNGTMAMEVQGDFNIERGYFNNVTRHVRILGNVINRQAFGVETATGIVRMEGTSPQEIFSDNGIFHTLSINNANGVTLTNGDLRVRRTMQLLSGNFYLGSHKLRVESAAGGLSVGSPSANRCFVTDGSAGAGGLEVIFRLPTQNTTFPLGVQNGPDVKYTPAVVRVNNDYDDEGFIRIVPVNSSLASANLSVADYLAFHWKVSHSEFETLPRVSHQFQYNNEDVVGSAANFVAGRVLFDAPFDRQFDELPVALSHVVTGSRWIFYNGDDVANASTGLGRVLTNAAYTAGHEDMFFGRPKVFYSRSSTMDADFNTGSNWNELAQFGPSAGPYQYHGTGVSGNTEYPQAGDIAFIGFDPSTGRPHSYAASAAGVAAAEVRFTPLQTASGTRLPRWEGPAAADITVLRPTFSFTSTAEIQNVASISGEGTILLRGNVDLSVVDIGNFLVEDSSIVMVQIPTSATLQLDHLPSEMPNFFVTSGSNGSTNAAAQPNANLKVRGDLEIAGNAKLWLATGVSGDIQVGRNLILAKYQAVSSGPGFRFRSMGTPRTVTVGGDLRIFGDGAQVGVLSPSAFPQLIHTLTVNQNIIQNAPASTGLNLFSNITQDYVSLELKGAGNHQFINSAGNAPVLGRIVIDKGNNLSSGFSFNSLINVNAPANEEVKPIELLNGLLTINHPSTAITLSNGARNYNIPSTAGIALGNGTLRINGNQIGLNLAGLLKIDGGVFELGNTEGQNNYIEYSAGGAAKIEVNGGQLNVGSQIRRGLTNTQGVLDFRQSGGITRVGIFDAPNANRGVLEIVNGGSRFDLTGGQLILVRGVNSTSTPSLLLQPTISNFNAAADVIIGSAASPSGAAMKNFGIQSSVIIPSLIINNDSGSDPVVSLYTAPLTIDDYLEISSGSTFDSRVFDLETRGDIMNNGTLKSINGRLIVNHSSLGTLSGAGVFDLNRFERVGGGVTSVEANLLVNGDFKLDQGIMSFGAHSLTAKGLVNIDGELDFSSGEGLIMNGNGLQTLRRTNSGTSYIDILTSDNPAGITQIASAGHSFVIGRDLRMKRGIFNLNGNLLELGESAVISQVNAFGQNNMISTGGALTNFGVRKALAANITEDLFVPLGLEKYMPIRLIFSDVNYSSGDTPSTYLFRLVQPAQNAVTDPNNALQMYFAVVADNIGNNLRMDLELNYDQDYVAVTGTNVEEDYLTARILDGDVFKGLGNLNTALNVLTFSFNNVSANGVTGDYFAGIDEAIPADVAKFITIRNGNVNEGGTPGPSGTYDEEVPGGGVPNGAEVRIANNHVLSFNVPGVVFYKTIIDENATLEIEANSLHRLGIVEGTGTIRLVNSGNLPNGNYNDFLTCTGGKLEFAGTANYEVLSNLPIARSVSLIGSGTRNMANNDVTICEDFLVDGPNFTVSSLSKLIVEGDALLENGTFNANQGDLEINGDAILTGGSFTAGNAGTRSFNGDVVINSGSFNVGSGGQTEMKGNFTRNGGTFIGGTASGSLIFSGEDEQLLTGDFTVPNNLRIVEINNPAGLRLQNNADVNHTLRLTEGKIYTEATSLIKLTTNSVVVEPTGGSANSFVNGPMEWALTGGANANLDRIFPIGRGLYHRPLRLAGRSAPLRTWTAEYHDTIAVVEPLIPTLDPFDPFIIRTVSKQEYWRVNSNSAEATTSRVGLSWGDNSVVAEEAGDYQKLVVLHWDNGNQIWQTAGAVESSFNFDAVANLGTFTSASGVPFSEVFFTLGSTDAINPLPVTWLRFNGATDGAHHTLNWATASEINNDYFELERSIDGHNFTTIAVVEGAGNSVTELSYQYVDKLAPAGRVYYRVKQVDFNGKFEYAPEVVTLIREEAEDTRMDFMLYPNPSNQGSVRIQISDFEAEMVIISVADMSGKILNRKANWIDEQGISDFISCDYQPGVYIVSVLHDGAMRSKPLVITK